MTAIKNKYDFTSGALLKRMIIFALPIIGVNVLQLLFTTADLTVLGIFTNDQAVAAVGATAQIINLFIGFFVGLSVATNVIIARCVGAKDEEKTKRVVGTSVLVSIIFGFVIMIVGVILAESFLIWINCAESVLPYATTYLRIYFLGMPIIMLYNFSASILRSVGDTLRPLIFLIIGGVVNIILNIFFVVVVKIDVAGVAIATVASQAVSAISAVAIMIKGSGYAKIEKKYLRIYYKEFKEIFIIGLPIGISKALFSLSNVLVMANLNSLGEEVMTSYSITREWDGFILEAVHGFGTAVLTVLSQNFGAKKFQRIKKGMILSICSMTSMCMFLGLILLFVGRSLCGIMTDSEIVLDFCMIRITTMSILYIALGILSVLQETIRAIGYTFTATLISVFANIVLRMIYIYFVYPFIYIVGNAGHNLRMLYILYPASWIIASIVSIVILVVLFSKIKRKFSTNEDEK